MIGDVESGRDVDPQGGTAMKKPPKPRKATLAVKIVGDDSDIFVVAGGVKIAKRGRPGSAQAGTWISLEPGWSVLDGPHGNYVEVTHEGVRVH